MRFENYAKFVDYYFGAGSSLNCLADSPLAKFHVDSFERLVGGNMRDLRKKRGSGVNRTCFQFRIWYRGAAKSVHAVIFIPIWLYLTGRCRFFVIVGVNNERANQLLNDVRGQLSSNTRLLADFGNYESLIKDGNNREGNFTATNGAHFMSIGIDQPIRGARNQEARVDYICIDDIEGKDNKKGDLLVPETVDRIKQDYMGAFSNKGERLMVICNNLFRPDGVIAKLLSDYRGKPFADISKVNLLDEKGEYTWKGGHHEDYAREKQSEIGHTGFRREYFNDPIAIGRLFNAKHLHFDKYNLEPINHEFIGFWDLSYTQQGDFKAFVLMSLVRRRVNDVRLERYYIKYIFCKQCSLRSAMEYNFELTRDLMAKGFKCLVYYDASVNQESVHAGNIEKLYDDYKYGVIPQPYRQQGNKYSRIESALRSPWETNKFCFDESLEETDDFKDGFNQILGFDKGSKSHDDFPDALSSCTTIMLSRHRNKWNAKIHGWKPKFD